MGVFQIIFSADLNFGWNMSISVPVVQDKIILLEFHPSMSCGQKYTSVFSSMNSVFERCQFFFTS